MKVNLSITIDGATAYATLSTLCSTTAAGCIAHSWDLPQNATLSVMAAPIVSGILAWIAAKRRTL